MTCPGSSTPGIWISNWDRHPRGAVARWLRSDPGIDLFIDGVLGLGQNALPQLQGLGRLHGEPVIVALLRVDHPCGRVSLTTVRKVPTA